MKEKVNQFISFLGNSLSKIRVNIRNRRRQGFVSRTLSVFIIATMIFTSSNLQGVRAEVAETSNSLETTGASVVENKDPAVDEAPIISEVKEKRTLNTKTFLHEDFTMTTATYPTNVFYEDESGELKEIDNSLILEGTDYTNKNNSFKITFASDVLKENLIRIREKNYGIDFSLKDDLKDDAKAERKTLSAEVLDQSGLDKTEKENAKKTDALNIGSGVIYRDVKPGIDLEYILQGSSVKENIYIKEKMEDASLSFDLNVTGLLIGINELGNIELKDKDSGKSVYQIPKPFMYDANNESTDKVEFVLEKTSDTKATIKYIPDSTWLNADGRAFPVVVDPPLMSSIDIDDIHDTFVDSSDLTDKWLNLYLRAGRSSTGSARRSFIHVPLPTIGSGDVVIKSQMNVYADGAQSSGTSYVKLHKNTTAVPNGTYQGTIWTNQPSYVAAPDDYMKIMEGTTGFYRFDITEMAKDWYQTGNNYGVALEADASTNGNEAVFRSSDTSSSSVRPYMTVQYINSTGIEGHQTYHTQDVGRAGTVYVNDYTGDITIEKPILVEKGEINPLSLTAYYNGNYRTVNGFLGYGWSLNISQYIKYKSGTLFADGITRYMHQDADGTQHYYVYYSSTDEWKDPESSTDTVMKINTADQAHYFDMKDKNNNHLYFNYNGKLTRIQDKNGNKIDISLDASNKPTSAVAKNADGDTLTTTTFAYNANSKLSTITDSRGKVYTITYTAAGVIDKITDPDSGYCQYAYTSNEVPAWVIDRTGGVFYYYLYTTAAPYRVTKVFERTNGNSFNTGTEPGMGIVYSHNTTTFTDFDGKKNTYQYNNLGQCTGIVDNDGNAIFNGYGSTGNTNNLKSQSKVEQTIVNLILNGSFQHDADWTYANTGGGTGTGAYSTTEKQSDSRSYKISKTNTSGTSSVYQNTTLTGGKSYTLSGYVKTTAMDSNAKAYLKVTYGAGANDFVKSDEISGVKDWERYTATFTMPATPSTYSAKAELVVEGGTGTVYFDAVQLEEGLTANRFNLVDNPSFLDGLSYYGYTSPTAPIIENGREGRKAAYFIGDPSATRMEIDQYVYGPGVKDDSFVVGVWAKANSGPADQSSDSTPKTFAIEARVNYIENGVSKFEYFAFKSFNDSFTDWQYLSLPIVTPRDYTSLVLFVTYDGNINKASFTDWHVYKEEFGSSYTYDDKGNVVSVKDNNQEESAFNYDANSNLKGVTNPNGGSYDYVYSSDGKNNLMKATTATGIKYNYTYNSVGRSLTNTISNDSTTDPLNIISSVSYTASNDNFTETKTDSKGYVTTNHWDYTLGRIDSVTDNAGGQVTYNYDTSGRLNKTTSKMNISNESVVNESVFISDKLSQIIHNGFNYNFEYDSYGMMTKTKVGSVDLVTNEYNNNTHMLTKSTYGNGTVFEPVYDSDYQLTGKKYGGTLAYEYIYGNQGELSTVKDNINLTTTNFLYDLSGRLVKSADNKGNKWVFGYDSHSNMNSIDKTQFGISEKESITFDDDNKVDNFKLHQGTNLKLDQTIVYDTIGRIKSIGAKDGNGTTVVGKSYEYKQATIDADTISDTTLVEKETIGSLVKDYTYDLKGNIKTITGGGDTITYTYDLIGQLTKEENEVTNEVIEYDYDTGGNIQSKTVTPDGGTARVYEYGYNSVWKDRLDTFDGKSLTYDQIGNPLTIGTSVLTWTQGRKLSTYKKDSTSDTATYTYDENGIRKTKTVGDEVIEYITSGGEVVAQKSNSGTPTDASDDVVITFTRGADGSLISMNRNGTIYYFVTNIQGDVEQILDSTGQVVVSYVYDAYGRVVSISDSLASTLGEENPFRYRSYYFDTESGYYYLQSRYYDPVTCRMINADSQINPGIHGNNMFAYCNNNPIMLVDRDGRLPFLAITAIVGAVAGAAVGGYLAAKRGKNIWAGIGIGAVGGALLGLGVGAGLGMISGAGAFATGTQISAGFTAIATGTKAAIISASLPAAEKAKQVFWAGGSVAQKAADTFAKVSQSGNIISKTAQGKEIIAQTKNIPWEIAKPMWESASLNFAQQASGTVNAFIYAPNFSNTSIFMTVELPALINNPNVKEIVIHIFGG